MGGYGLCIIHADAGGEIIRERRWLWRLYITVETFKSYFYALFWGVGKNTSCRWWKNTWYSLHAQMLLILIGLGISDASKMNKYEFILHGFEFLLIFKCVKWSMWYPNGKKIKDTRQTPRDFPLLSYWKKKKCFSFLPTILWKIHPSQPLKKILTEWKVLFDIQLMFQSFFISTYKAFYPVPVVFIFSVSHRAWKFKAPHFYAFFFWVCLL
jgi:hypothetical protein